MKINVWGFLWSVLLIQDVSESYKTMHAESKDVSTDIGSGSIFGSSHGDDVDM